MMQIYTTAMGAMKAANYLEHLLRRPVVRSITLNKYGAPLWVISLDKAPHNAL